MLCEETMKNNGNSAYSDMNNQKNCECSCQSGQVNNAEGHQCEDASAEFHLDDAERQKCEIWSRVMGYYRPTSNYNVGKKSEYDDRKFFAEPSKEKLEEISEKCGDCVSRAA